MNGKVWSVELLGRGDVLSLAGRISSQPSTVFGLLRLESTRLVSS